MKAFAWVIFYFLSICLLVLCAAGFCPREWIAEEEGTKGGDAK